MVHFQNGTGKATLKHADRLAKQIGPPEKWPAHKNILSPFSHA